MIQKYEFKNQKKPLKNWKKNNAKVIFLCQEKKTKQRKSKMITKPEQPKKMITKNIKIFY